MDKRTFKSQYGKSVTVFASELGGGRTAIEVRDAHGELMVNALFNEDQAIGIAEAIYSVYGLIPKAKVDLNLKSAPLLNVDDVISEVRKAFDEQRALLGSEHQHVCRGPEIHIENIAITITN